MIVVVCGSRNSQQKDHIWSRLDAFQATRPITLLVEGGQRTRDRSGKIVGGVDFWASQWAKKNRIKTEPCYAKWKDFGKSAGPMRNMEMLVKYKPDAVIAFPGGFGTENMVRQARQFKTEVVRLA